MSIANSSSYLELFAQVKQIYNLCYDEPQMNQETATSCDIKSQFPTKYDVLRILKFYFCVLNGLEVFKDGYLGEGFFISNYTT